MVRITLPNLKLALFRFDESIDMKNCLSSHGYLQMQKVANFGQNGTSHSWLFSNVSFVAVFGPYQNMNVSLIFVSSQLLQRLELSTFPFK
jgi:hypothetical protein